MSLSVRDWQTVSVIVPTFREAGNLVAPSPRQSASRQPLATAPIGKRW